MEWYFSFPLMNSFNTFNLFSEYKHGGNVTQANTSQYKNGGYVEIQVVAMCLHMHNGGNVEIFM